MPWYRLQYPQQIKPNSHCATFWGCAKQSAHSKICFCMMFSCNLSSYNEYLKEKQTNMWNRSPVYCRTTLFMCTITLVANLKLPVNLICMCLNYSERTHEGAHLASEFQPSCCEVTGLITSMNFFSLLYFPLYLPCYTGVMKLYLAGGETFKCMF